MLNMSDLSIELKSTEKSYTFPFKDTFLDSVVLNPLDILPRQKWVGKLNIFIFGFKFIDFFSIYKQITITCIIMPTETQFFICFSKINIKLSVW